ncbi:MAG TPA: helix-turn-helix domain-containing protein, partial [Azospirillaceae bacterium]|nr:helix-turn-helix domain-containing protein [Azospirillaceae bacterium]
MTNKDFYGRRDRLRRRINAAKLRPATKLVGLTMLDHVNREVATSASNGLMLCWPSVAALMAATGLSERSVTRARAELAAAGVVQKVGPAHEGRYAFRSAWADEQARGRDAEKTAAVVAAAEQALATPPPAAVF